MSSTTCGPSGPPSGHPDLGVPDLRERIRRLRELVGESAEMSAVLVELEATYEHLRVAAAEIDAQQEEIQRLRTSQQLLRWQHQRVQQMLPIALVTTDAGGLVTAANAAAATLFGLDIVTLVRRDLFGLFAPEDRGPLRSAMAGLVDGARLRCTASIAARGARVVPVGVTAVTGSPDAGEVTWAFTPAADSDESAAQVAISAALVGLAALPAGVQDADLLRAAAELCREALEQALGPAVALSLNAGSPTAPSGLASSSSTAQQVDGAQLAAEDGPSVRAFQTRRTVASANLATDERWSRLRELPDVGAIAVPLVVGDDVLGVLSVYSDVEAASQSHLVRAVEMLGAGVAAVLHEGFVRRQLQQEAVELETALQSRSTIDQAKGIVMAERTCTAQEAFDHLVELSSTQHLKLRDVARILVERASGGAAAG